MRRRDFFRFAGGLAAAGSPLCARAQSASAKRVGVLMGANDNDSQYQARWKAFREALAASGWREGQNIHLDIRWGSGDRAIRQGAEELIALAPDVLLANAPPSVIALQSIRRAIPIVFAAV